MGQPIIASHLGASDQTTHSDTQSKKLRSRKPSHAAIAHSACTGRSQAVHEPA